MSLTAAVNGKNEESIQLPKYLQDDIDSDDTSNEAIGNKRLKEITDPHTNAVPKNTRKMLKRNVKHLVHLLKLDPSKEIPLTLEKDFAKHKLQCGIKDKAYKDVIKRHMDNLESVTMQLNATHGDEEINHVMHMASLMEADVHKLEWSKPSWWFDVVTTKWVTLDSKKNKVNLVDIKKLPNDKSPLWENCYGNAAVLQKVFEHCIDELERLIPKMQQARQDAKKWGKIRLSTYGIVRLFQSAMFYYENDLASHTCDEKTNEYKGRDMYMSDNVLNWVHRSYANMNELPYLMLFNGVDSNGTLNPLVQNGISTNIDCTLSVSRLVDTVDHQRGFVEHYAMALLKFVVFFPVVETGIKGEWTWTTQSMHLPLHDIFNVIKAVSYAFYWRPSDSCIDTPVPKTDSKEKPFRYASTTQRNKWKTHQICAYVAHAWCNPKVRSDQILSSAWPMNVESGFFTKPYSTARSIFCNANLKAKGSKLASVKYRGIGENDMHLWKQEKQSCNMIKCSSHIAKLHCWTKTMRLETIPQISGKIMDVLLCDFSTDGAYETAVDDEITDTAFAKLGYVVSVKPWHNVDSSKRFQQLTRVKLYYGDNHRCMDATQWFLSNSSVSYKMVVDYIWREPDFFCWVIVDQGMITNGNDWNVDDTESDEFEVLNQDESIAKEIRMSKKRHVQNRNSVQSPSNIVRDFDERVRKMKMNPLQQSSESSQDEDLNSPRRHNAIEYIPSESGSDVDVVSQGQNSSKNKNKHKSIPKQENDDDDDDDDDFNNGQSTFAKQKQKQKRINNKKIKQDGSSFFNIDDSESDGSLKSNNKHFKQSNESWITKVDNRKQKQKSKTGATLVKIDSTKNGNLSGRIPRRPISTQTVRRNARRTATKKKNPKKQQELVSKAEQQRRKALAKKQIKKNVSKTNKEKAPTEQPKKKKGYGLKTKHNIKKANIEPNSKRRRIVKKNDEYDDGL